LAPRVTVTKEGWVTTFPDESVCKATWTEPMDEADAAQIKKLLQLQADDMWRDKQEWTSSI
jgi:hypothetical protein